MHRVHGKGLTGFIFGLLCATAAIMGVLYFLNHSSSGLRQDAQTQTPEKTPVEIVRPKGAGMPLPDARTASDALKPLEPSASLPKQADDNQIDRPNRAVSDVAMHDDTASEPKPAPKPQPQPRKPEATVADKPTPQPSAEQILNSGSIEKAREEVQRQAQRDNRAQNHERRASRNAVPQRAVEPTAEQILNSGSVEKARAEANRQAQRNQARAQANASSGSRNRVQAGAFASEAAAKARQEELSRMGVRAQIQAYTANGKRLYGVRSGSMSREQADALANRLRGQGIEAIVK